MKILAVTSANPVEGVDAPTLKSLNVDLVFTNWRGIVAPPGLPDEKKKQFVELLTKMHESRAVEDDPDQAGLDRRLPDR